jgi:excisionase family DNA binding protein
MRYSVTTRGGVMVRKNTEPLIEEKIYHEIQTNWRSQRQQTSKIALRRTVTDHLGGRLSSHQNADQVMDAALTHLEAEGRIEQTLNQAGVSWFRPHSTANGAWSSVEQASAHLGVSKRTLYAWVKSKRLRAYTTPGKGLLRFEREDLDAVLTLHEGSERTATTAVLGTDDPVLTELWDNEADAAYDKL